jgi:hypothetical protein
MTGRVANTAENPYVQRALQESGLEMPVDVSLGEETLDEMCLAAFGIVFDGPPAAAALPARMGQ